MAKKAAAQKARRHPARQLIALEDTETNELVRVWTSAVGLKAIVRGEEAKTGRPHRLVKFVREDLVRTGGAG